jgi:methionyl-tRNA formyltransferase
MRILFFGMDGIFSVAPLTALLGQSSVQIAGVLVPSIRSDPQRKGQFRFLQRRREVGGEIPVLSNAANASIIQIAHEANIPVIEVSGRLSSIDPSDLESLLPDDSTEIILVACFNQILPRWLVEWARLGAFNLHPSLLPAYRGPEPLFWIFHDGLEYAGVSIHLMDEAADSGDIVAQTRVMVPDGTCYSDAERQCSIRGAELLVQVIRSTDNGNLERFPQDHSRASRAPFPMEADYIVEKDWDKRRAFNFIHGLKEWDAPICVRDGSKLVRVRDAIAVGHSGPEKSNEGDREAIKIRFADGDLILVPK